MARWSVIDNDIAFSQRNLGMAEPRSARRVDEALALVDARPFRHQPIQCLSHGQKKRVSIAGALVLQAKYLLHAQLGLPLCKTEDEFFHHMRNSTSRHAAPLA